MTLRGRRRPPRRSRRAARPRPRRHAARSPRAAAQVRRCAARPARARPASTRLAADGRPRAVVVAGTGGSGSPARCWPRSAAGAARCPSSIVRGYGCPAGSARRPRHRRVRLRAAPRRPLARGRRGARRGCRLVARRAGRLAAGRHRRAGRRAVRAGRARPARAREPVGADRPAAAGRATRSGSPTSARALERGRRRAGGHEPTSAARPVESFVNPAKALALELAGDAAGHLGHVAAGRRRRPAGSPPSSRRTRSTRAVLGELPEACHNRSRLLRRPVRPAGGGADDLFRDRGRGRRRGRALRAGARPRRRRASTRR